MKAAYFIGGPLDLQKHAMQSLPREYHCRENAPIDFTQRAPPLPTPSKVHTYYLYYTLGDVGVYFHEGIR